MKVEHKDFIAVYSDVFPKGYCQHLIQEFERLASGGAGVDRQQGENAPKHAKNDLQLGLNIKAHYATNFESKDVVDFFFHGLQACFDQYIKEYSVLKEGPVKATVMKMQRTSPGGGYHIWHSEQGPGVHANRVAVYMLYLNTLEPEEAGETEFLYQQVRLRPQENTMVIWPAAYTHAHRGNTVFGNRAKYIVTGWFYYD